MLPSHPLSSPSREREGVSFCDSLASTRETLSQKVLQVSSHFLLTQTGFYVAREPVPVAGGMPRANQLRVPAPVTAAREMALLQFKTAFLWSWEWQFPLVYVRVILVPESGYERKGREGNGTGALEATNNDHHSCPSLPQCYDKALFTVAFTKLSEFIKLLLKENQLVSLLQQQSTALL